jgi:hypothetical protein
VWLAFLYQHPAICSSVSTLASLSRFPQSRRPRVLLDILDVQEILSEFFVGDQIGRLVIVIRKLADGANIGFLSSH